MTVTIRAATAEDGDACRAVERAAGVAFREVGMDAIADDEPMSVAQLAAYAADGRSWVAVGPAGVAGYVVVDVVDGNAHVEQISVHPEHQGRGVGRSLLDQVRAWAGEQAMPAVTLTTFSDVPWNAPLYRHLGFVDLTPSEVGPQLAALVTAEAVHGLDPVTRTCMRLDLLHGQK